MKLQYFKTKDRKKIGVLFFTMCCILLIAGAFFFRSFALYQVKEGKNMIQGYVQIPQEVHFVYWVDGTIQKEMPQKEESIKMNAELSYCKELGEDTSSLLPILNEKEWKIEVSEPVQNKTKCVIYFEKEGIE